MKINFSVLFLVSVLALLFVAGCQEAGTGNGIEGGQKQVTEREDCVCIAVHDPVCGSNRITYTNSCFAGCAGVSWTKGAC